MKNFNKKIFTELASVHASHCISIYMPTHRANDEGKGYQMDRLMLKNLLKEVHKQLEVYKVDEAEIEKQLKPVHNLLEQEDFWAHQSDGLAIFLYEGKMKTFNLPVDFDEQAYVNSHLNVKPLVNFLSDTKTCFLLSLSLNSVELYQVNSTEVFRIEVGDLIPQKMTDTVGEDYEEKQLEGRVSNSKSGQDYDVYHGHGRSNDTIKKEEALRFFHQVNNGLQKLMNEKKLPLIVACVDYLFPIYKEANSYHFLREEHITGNPEHEKLETLAAKAMDIISNHHESEIKASTETYNSLLNEGKSSNKLDDIVPAAIGGRIKHLMIRSNTEIWGRYERDTHSIEIKSVRSVRDTDLVNLATVETIKHGGDVIVLGSLDMPAEDADVAAIYRF